MTNKHQVLVGATYKNRTNSGLYNVYHIDSGIRVPSSVQGSVDTIYLELKTKPFLSFTYTQQLVTVPATEILRHFKHYQTPDGRYVVDDDYNK